MADNRSWILQARRLWQGYPSSRLLLPTASGFDKSSASRIFAAATSMYYYEVTRLFYKWLNRRSQRRSMTWTQFTRRLPDWKLPPPKVVEIPSSPGLLQTTNPA